MSIPATTELLAEYGLAVDRLLDDTAAIERMFSLGVTVDHWRESYARLGGPPLGLSVDGEFIQPVVAYDELVDLIAWPAADPSTWKLRRDMAVVLGEEEADRASLLDEPLAIYASPLGWLRSFGAGACVLDWKACLRLHLGATRLLVSDRGLGNRLTRALATPPATFEIRMAA